MSTHRPSPQTGSQLPAGAAPPDRFGATFITSPPPETHRGEDLRTKLDSETTSATAAVQDGAGLTSGMLGGIVNALGMHPPTAREARLEKDNLELKEENKLLRSEFYKVETAARKYHHDAFRFRHENQRLQETLEAMSLEVKGVAMRYEEVKSLSETRLKRLLAAQLFLTLEADSQSISELIQKVDSLNHGIDRLDASSNTAQIISRPTLGPTQHEVSNNTKAEIQDGADPLPSMSASTTSPHRKKKTSDCPTTPSVGPDDNHSGEAGTSNVAGLTSGMLGGIANALAMHPPTARAARLEKDNLKLRGENKFLRSEYHKIEKTARKYYDDAFRFHNENQRLQDTLQAMSLEVKGVTKRYEEAKSLSETRLKRLLAAQVSLILEADSQSISELIQKVDGLNDEIYQAAASLGESIVQKKVESSEQSHYSSEESSIAKTLLGSPLCKVLRSRARKIEEGINPLLVQITLQTFFVVFCAHRIGSWIPSHLEFDATLQELYERIWSSSDQAVSGRWRSLTRAQLKPDTNVWIKELMTDLDAILALASWEVGSPEDKHTLEARLPAIFKVVLDVREAIGEKFTSDDIEVSFIEPYTPFNKAYMEESYAADSSEGHEKDPEIVISTVGMGVRKVVSIHGGRGYEYVLEPKVVLESSLKAILEPPPHPRKGY